MSVINYNQFVKPTKCTQIFSYKYYLYRSDMFRLCKHHLLEHVMPNLIPIVIKQATFYGSTVSCLMTIGFKL
jgi:hypothetical protein